jgi:predicted transcriptional regulator of viral defense system
MTQLTRQPKNSLRGIELVRRLSTAQERVFTIERARDLAPDVRMKQTYVAEALHHLRRTGWIVPIKRGVYAVSSLAPGVAAVHEYELAMALVEPAAISHWSAMHYHGLTEQIPRTVFVLTTVESPVLTNAAGSSPESRGLYRAGNATYRFIRVKPDRYFGTQTSWIGEARFTITDPERTLLDGLSRPWYCGDFGEVMNGFATRRDQLDLGRITDYALKLDMATAKRLGWVLEKLGISGSELSRLEDVPIKSVRRLVANGPDRGPYDRRWMLRINLPGASSR